MLLDHAGPGGLVAILEVQPFAVRTIAEQDRVAPWLDRPENVGTQHETVVDCDRHVPVDAHAVPDLAHLAIAHQTPSRSCGQKARQKAIGMLTGPQRSSW